MSFRLRLALLFVTTLVAVQVFTAVLVYEVARRGVIAEGEHQLVAQADAVSRQLDDISDRVADNVHLLSLDYALRTAIAQRDEGTVYSALRNHGRRIGATRMLLIGLDGTVRSDTSELNVAAKPFPFPDLIDVAFAHPAAAVVALEGKAYWMIVVPIYAPAPVALIAAGIPVDDALLAHLQQMSSVPNSLELIFKDDRGSWVDMAHSGRLAIAAELMRNRSELPLQPTVVRVNGREYVALAQRLKESERGASVAVLLAYSLDDALFPYRTVAYAWAGLLLLGLAAGLIGAMAMARSVARPIEALAETARRIEAGDYTADPPARGRGEIGQLAGAFTRMTQAISEREAHIHYQAMHDAVTTLPNRHAVELTMRKSLSEEPAQGALLLAGLMRLPEIIQTVGHAIGDRAMRDASKRLQVLCAHAAVARATDTQFAIWLPHTLLEDAVAMATRIVETLSGAYRESGLSLDTAPAVGIALAPAHGHEADLLLRRAEVALMNATGKEHAVAVYEAATDPHRSERLGLMGDLRAALEGDQLLLCYQPKLTLSTNTIDEVEALLRWRHPTRGLLFPDAFIELAEQTGNIRALSRWVIDRSVAQAAKWNRGGRPVRVSINLSARDLDDIALPELVQDTLDRHRVDPRHVVVELTESAVISKPEAAIEIFNRLAEYGVELAVDDFGIGHSSFAYLRRLPVRELKIDRLFTGEVTGSSRDQVLLQSMVEFGHRLGYRVTAEGVEDGRTLNFLRKIGCDHVQGYHIAKAGDAPSIERMLDARSLPSAILRERAS
ncbi:MAG: EAL domain-containing protein [Dokdonella sp.]